MDRERAERIIEAYADSAELELPGDGSTAPAIVLEAYATLRETR